MSARAATCGWTRDRTKPIPARYCPDAVGERIWFIVIESPDAYRSRSHRLDLVGLASHSKTRGADAPVHMNDMVVVGQMRLSGCL